MKINFPTFPASVPIRSNPYFPTTDLSFSKGGGVGGEAKILKNDHSGIFLGSLDELRSIIEKNIAEGEMKLRC